LLSNRTSYARFCLPMARTT